MKYLGTEKRVGGFYHNMLKILYYKGIKRTPQVYIFCAQRTSGRFLKCVLFTQRSDFFEFPVWKIITMPYAGHQAALSSVTEMATVNIK